MEPQATVPPYGTQHAEKATMADSGDTKAPAPMNIYTAMMVLSFVAISIGCLILAIELWSRGLPLDPKAAPRRSPVAAPPSSSPAEPPADDETPAEDAASDTE